jgi:uncharacterized membrane protein YccF (DUF307 family)
MTVVIQRNQPGCLVQGLWFIFIGWWATGLWISLAWVLCVLIITLPFGVMMLNSVPKVVALREPGGDLRVQVVSASGQLVDINRQQRPFLLRAVYFLLIGWWWSAIVILLAYFFALTVLGLPIAFWLFDRVPGAVTLRR